MIKYFVSRQNQYLRVALTVVTMGLCTNAATAYADTCDYRPSKLLGESGSKVAIGTGGAIAGGTATASALGIYTLVNAGSGLTMLGSTMAGASGAGTIGIIAGTGGALGTTGAVILNPFVWIPAAIVGVGGAGFEAGCAFLVDERITEYEDVLRIVRSFATHANPKYFSLEEGAIKPFITLFDENGSMSTYKVESLYIVDGVLKSRDYGPNTTIGRVILLSDKAQSD